VKRFIDSLTDEEAADVAAAMKEVREHGTVAARHLRGDIYEVRVDSVDKIFRILFATEGRFSQVLLSLDGFNKKTKKTPPDKINLAEGRLADWRRRGKGR
jgi:phage-related protein